MALHATGAGAGRRQRDATVTRAAILAAARRCFAAAGYEGVTVRGIAAAAGVDAALVLRYFGSKDGLFAAVLSPLPGSPVLPSGPLLGLGERLVRHLLDQGDAGDLAAPLLVAARSTGNARVAALARRAVDETFVVPLAERLAGTERHLRAGLVAAQLLGLAQCRYILRLEPIASSEVDVLVGRVGPILQGSIDDDRGDHAWCEIEEQVPRR